MGIKVKIWWDSQIQAYRISCPYNPSFLIVLKTLVPSSDRAYDGTTKIWTFTERFLIPIQALTEKFWQKGEIAIITKDQSNQASSPPALVRFPTNDAALEFLRLLPYEVAQKAYKNAAMILHPDRGGDATRMSQLNALWNKLQKEVWENGK